MRDSVLHLFHYLNGGVYLYGANGHDDPVNLYMILHKVSGPVGNREVVIDFVGIGKGPMCLSVDDGVYTLSSYLQFSVGTGHEPCYGDVEIIYRIPQWLKVRKIHTAPPPSPALVAAARAHLIDDCGVARDLVDRLSCLEEVEEP